MDLDYGSRIFSRLDFQNFLKLAQAYNCIHFNCGYAVEPMDMHPSIRYLDGLFDALTLTNKAVHAYALGTGRVEDAMEMARIGAGLTHEAFEDKARMFTNIHSTLPLKHDWQMLDGAIRMAACRRIFRKDASVWLKKRAFLQRPLKHLRANVTTRGNRNNRACPFRILAC